MVGTFYLHTQTVEFLSIIAGLQVGFLATILIAINNLRDSDTDVDANKKTLAVRFGDNFVRWEIAFLVAAIFGLNFMYGEKPFVNLSFLILPVALIVLYSIWSIEDKRLLNKSLGMAALLQMGFGILFSVGLVL